MRNNLFYYNLIIFTKYAVRQSLAQNTTDTMQTTLTVIQ